jgi:hypothetical protein
MATGREGRAERRMGRTAKFVSSRYSDSDTRALGFLLLRNASKRWGKLVIRGDVF